MQSTYPLLNIVLFTHFPSMFITIYCCYGYIIVWLFGGAPCELIISNNIQETTIKISRCRAHILSTQHLLISHH